MAEFVAGVMATKLYIQLVCIDDDHGQDDDINDTVVVSLNVE